MDPLLSDAKRRVVGTRQILRMARQGKLLVVYLALDTDPVVRKEILDACDTAGVPVKEAGSMQELGLACRISVGAAAAGILAQ